VADAPIASACKCDMTAGSYFTTACQLPQLSCYIVLRISETSAHCFAGATLHEGEAVVSWQPTPDGGVRVETQQGVYTAQRLVLTAGAWLPQLVPALQVGCTLHTTYDTSPSSLLL
jgi:hypothetical protein